MFKLTSYILYFAIVLAMFAPLAHSEEVNVEEERAKLQREFITRALQIQAKGGDLQEVQRDLGALFADTQSKMNVLSQIVEKQLEDNMRKMHDQTMQIRAWQKEWRELRAQESQTS